MHFLLSYSADHFDPDLPRDEHAHWGMSANVISRTIHAELAKRGDVTFIDATEPDRVEGQAFDAFIGIQRNFGPILERCTVGRSMLVGVNMHPAEHNDLLLDFVVRERLPAATLHALDMHDVHRRVRDLEAADSVLLFGNSRTLESYLSRGIPGEKIRMINYRVDLETERSRDRPAREWPETRILYSASEIGLRKGFDIVAALAEEADLGGLRGDLHIVGTPSYPHYRAKLDGLVDRLSPNVTNHGWLPASSAEYRTLLERSDYLLFPSLEEGQAGTVLDAMACGVIPLISPNCGVDFAPLGFCELEQASERNRELLRRACALSPAERSRLRQETLDYYDEFHAGFDGELARAIDELLAGSTASANGRGRTVAGRSTASSGPSAGLGGSAPSLRQRARRRYLEARLRWFNSWKFHQALGGVRRRLPI